MGNVAVNNAAYAGAPILRGLKKPISFEMHRIFACLGAAPAIAKRLQVNLKQANLSIALA